MPSTTDDFDDDAPAAPITGGALLYNPGLSTVTNSVRAGLGSGLEASGLSALISRSAEFPPTAYAALGFAASPAPQRVLQVGSAHTSAAAQARAQRQARGEMMSAADATPNNTAAAASSQLLHALPLPQPLRPVPPVSSGSHGAALQGQDKPLHRRLVSFAVNQSLGGRRDAATAVAGSAAAAASSAATSAITAAATVAASSDPAQPLPQREGSTHEERGKALDNMIALITTISSLKRWKNKSLQSVDRSLDALRLAAESFMTQTNPIEWGAKISDGLSLSAAPALAMKQARDARTKIEENDRIVKSIESKVEESIASAGAARHGPAAAAAASSSSQPSMYLQGDLSCYTTLKYLQRISNSFHLDLLTLIKRFFDTTDQVGPVSGSAQGQGFVGKMSYIHLLLLIHKQLMPLTPAAEAVRIVLQDWEQDSRAFGVRVASGPPRSNAATGGSTDAPSAGVPTGEIAFSLPAFHSCLFQLVDHWTLGCDVSEYLSLMAGLFSKITQPNPEFSARPGPGADRRKVVFKPLTVEYSRALEAALTASPEHRLKRRAGAAGGLAGLMGTQPGFQKGTKSIKGVSSSPRPAVTSPMGSPRSTLRRASGTGSILGGAGGSSSNEGSKRNSGVGLSSGLGSSASAVSAFLASHGIDPPPSLTASGGGDSSSASSAMQTPNRSREGSALAHRGTRARAAKALAIDTAGASEGAVIEYVPSDEEDADHLDVTADGRSRSRTDRVPRPMPETPMAASSSAATAAESKPAPQHHIVHHPAPESKDGGNLTVVSLGGGLKAKAPVVVSAATKALLGEMAELIHHAAEGVDDNATARKHRAGKKGTKKKGAGGKGKAKAKHKRHGSDEASPAAAAAAPSVSDAATAAAAAGPSEQHRSNLESESSTLPSPSPARRSNALRRLELQPFDPLSSRLSAAPIVGKDGTVNYALLDPSIAELVKPRLGVQPSGTWRSRDEEDALIGAELSPLEGDASREHSTAAAAVEARRQAREADRRARRAARLAQGHDDLDLDEDEFSNSEADSAELAEEEERRIREAELRALEDEELRNPLPLHSKRVDTPSGSSVGSNSRPSSRDATHPSLPSFPIAAAVASAVVGADTDDGASTQPPPLDVAAAVAAALGAEEAQTKDRRDARRSARASGKDASAATAAAVNSVALSATGDAASSDSATITTAAGSPVTTADRSNASLFAMGLPEASGSMRTKRLSNQRTMGGGFARKRSSLGENEAAMTTVKGAAPASASTTAVEPSPIPRPAASEEPLDSPTVADASARQPEKRMSAVTEKRLAKRAAAAAAAPLPPVAVPAPAAASVAAPRGSSQSPSRAAASGVAENAAWFAHMTSLGRDAVLSAALAHATEVAARAEEDARRAGLELPPQKTGEATVLATDVEVALRFDDDDDDDESAALLISGHAMGGSESVPKVTEVVAPLRALRATSAGRSRTKLRGEAAADVPAQPQTKEQHIANLADSIATRLEQAADARFARPAIVDPSAAVASAAQPQASPPPKSPMYAPALTVAAPGIVSLGQQQAISSPSASLRSPSLSTHSSRAVSRRPSVLLAPGSPVVVSGQPEDLRGVLVVEPASLNPSLLSPTATAAASSPTRTSRDGGSPVVGAFGTHTAQRRAERINKESANAAAAVERERVEAEAAAAEDRDALVRDLAREGYSKRDSTSSGSEFAFVPAAATAAAGASAPDAEQQRDAEVPAAAAQRSESSSSDARSSVADVPAAASVAKTSDRTKEPAATPHPSSSPLPDDWADQVDSFFNKPAAAAANVDPALGTAPSGPLTAADLASTAPPTPRGGAAAVVIPTGLSQPESGFARSSGQPSPRNAAAAATATQNKYSVAFLNSAATTGSAPAPALSAAPESQPSGSTLSESPSSLLSTAILSTREALHALSSYHGPPSGRAGSLSGNHVLPLDVSREILAAIQALRPVESLPLAPTLRPASAAPTKVATSARGKRNGAPAATARPQSRDSAMPAVPTPDAASAAAAGVSLHELEDLGLSLESLLSRSRPSGRRTVPVGQVRLLGAMPAAGSSSSANAAAAWRPGSSSGGVGLNPSVQTIAALEAAQARERAALKRGPDEAQAIISANLREAQALHSARGAPPFGGLDVHAYATTSDKAERSAAGSREVSPVRHVAFAATSPTIATTLTAAAASAGLSPLIGANSFKLPSSPRAAGGSRRQSSGLAGIQTQAAARTGAAGAPVSAGSTSLAASDPQLKPFTSLSSFAAVAALIPAPAAPRANETVHLSSGEVLQGWQQDHEAAAQQPQQVKSKRAYKRPALHHEEGGFDVAAGVNAAFDPAPEAAPSVASAPPAAVDPAAVAASAESSGVWNHAATLADEFEWHMPSSAARLTQGQGSRRGRRGQQQQQPLDAPIPIRKVAQSASDPVAFSPRSYSRALRMVVDRSRLTDALQQQQQQQAAQLAAQEQARLQQQQQRQQSISPERMVDSLFTADGQIKGWNSSFEEEKQNATVSAAGGEKTTMMMLANGGLQHISLNIAATPTPYSILSPYLPPPTTAAASAASPSASASSSPSVAASPASAAAFPHEIHSSKFAALTASFNAHPGSSAVFGGLHSAARPKTAERWQTSREGPAALMHAAATTGPATARPASQQLNPVHAPARALTHRGGSSGVRTGAHAHAHYSRPSTSHASLMLTPAAPITSSARELSPPPPPMRSTAGVGGGWVASAPSVPSIPRSRADLLTSHAVDSVDPGFKPRNSFVIPPSATQQQTTNIGGVHSDVAAAKSSGSGALGSHWHASAVRAIPPPEPSRFTYAPPFHALHGTNTPSSGYIHAIAHGVAQPPHMHALGPHESLHAYPTANVYVGSQTARSARPSPSASSAAAAAAYAASKSGFLTGRSRRRYADDDADLTLSSVSPFYAPVAVGRAQL